MISSEEMVWIDEAVSCIVNKMDWVSEKSRNKIPYTTIDGTHDNRAVETMNSLFGDGIDWWTNGFWGGMMWLMYHHTKEQRYADIAKFSEVQLDRCFERYYGLHHDVGFMWLPTAVANYRITKDENGRKRGMHAANLLAGRFNPSGKFIRAWNSSFGSDSDNSGWAIIDCMLNIPLLYWASEESKDPRFKHIAIMHADTAMKVFIRDDGSVRHIVEFDSETGEVLRDFGGQGYALGSSWTRGQAWGMYGFLMSYVHTKNEVYLNTAKRIAHYFIANIPENGIIPVDFRQPKEPAWEDSTAAAIASCALIEISRQVDDLESEMYLKAALKMLKTLFESRSDWSTDCDCILTNCTAAYHDKNHHFSIIYGDYFFMEALFKLKGNDIFLW